MERNRYGRKRCAHPGCDFTASYPLPGEPTHCFFHHYPKNLVIRIGRLQQTERRKVASR